MTPLMSPNLCHTSDSLMGCPDGRTSYCVISPDNLSDIIPACAARRASFYDASAWYILYSVEKNLWHCSPGHGPLCLVAFCGGRHIYGHFLCVLRGCVYVHASVWVCAALKCGIRVASTPFLLIKFGGEICMSSPSDRRLWTSCGLVRVKPEHEHEHEHGA